jgi:hypothetical protein
MGNLLRELSETHGFTVRGAQAWGTVDGYWFQVALPAYGANALKIRTAVRYPDETAASAVGAALTKMSRDNPSLNCTRNGGVAELDVKKGMGGFKTQEVEGFMRMAAAAFREAGAEPACLNCGDSAPDSFVMVNGTAMKLCSKCRAEIEGTIVQGAEAHAAAQNNYLRGALGAVLGALVGSIAWIVIGLLGYIAAIGGVAISFCAIKGYQLMKGKVTKLAVLIICLVSIVVMIAAVFITLDIVVLKDNPQAGFGNVMQAIFQMLFVDADVTSEVVKDCLLGLLFLAIGSYSVVKPFFAKAKAPAGTFERL